MAEQQHKRRRQRERNLTSIVRIAGRDIDGELGIERALLFVKGIGHSMAHALAITIESKLNIPRSTSIGSLSEENVEAIEKIIKNPLEYNVPKFMLNRRKDFETGKNLHYTGNDLIFATRQDISREVSLRTWKGYRHQYGQKVRGQRTRSTGRKGVTVGVMKKATLAQQKAAASRKGGKKR